MDGHQREIASIRALGIAQSAAVAEEWECLTQGRPRRRTEGQSRLLLLDSFWEQDRPYNDACPYDSTARKRTLTGCTATATAQVMRYWRHPERGRGTHTYSTADYGQQTVVYDSSVYDWDNIPVRVNVGSPQAQRDAVAKLCYEVGVGMNMRYGTGASGAYAHSGGMLWRRSAEQALEKHFYYNPGMYNACMEGYTEAEWDDLMSSELNAGRPLIYTGSSSSGGHAFVVDGYDTTGLYHVNWGWGGVDNGFYNLARLIIGTPNTYGYAAYNEMNEALIGVYPITPNASTSEVNVVSSDPTRGSVSGSGTYAVDGDRAILLATAAPGYRFSHWASGNRFNPIFYYPTVDYADTAYFVPLSRDTLGYGMGFVPNFDTLYSLTHCEWGIRIPTDYLTAGRQLEQVRTFAYTTGHYVLRIYQGERPQQPVYETVKRLQSYGWRNIVLDEPLAIDPTQPLWITFAADSVKYCMGITPYTGVDDGMWVVRDGEWQLVDTAVTGYYTWSIQGITGISNGIAEAEADGLECTLDGLLLTVDNPQGRLLAFYDLQGRLLATPTRDRHACFTLPSAGAFLLQADGLKARRIVAVR